MKSLGQIISQFVRLGNNDWYQLLEVQWPKTEVDTNICNINEIWNTSFIRYQNFSPRVNELLHFLIILVNSTLEKNSHSVKDFAGISSRKQRLICQSWAELKVLWKTSQRSSNLIHGCPLKLITSVARNLQFFDLFHEISGSLVF